MADSVVWRCSWCSTRWHPRKRPRLFVLHDLFFGALRRDRRDPRRTPDATKMSPAGLASGSRQPTRRAATMTPPATVPSCAHSLAAARSGDLDALLAVLHPEVVLRADRTAVARGRAARAPGAADVAGQVLGRERLGRPALIDGAAGAVWAPRRKAARVFDFAIAGGRIVARRADRRPRPAPRDRRDDPHELTPRYSGDAVPSTR